jgi:CHASE3 domain sensor protein
MAKEKKNSAARTRRMLILSGCLLIAILVLLLLPTNVNSGSTKEPNELELRQELSAAADDYMLSRNTEERQQAARHMRSIRAGNDDRQAENTAQAMSFLRVVIIITIVVLAYHLFKMSFPKLRFGKSS